MQHDDIGDLFDLADRRLEVAEETMNQVNTAEMLLDMVCIYIYKKRNTIK